MTRRSRYRGRSDAEFEDLIRGLACRKPSGTLRARVLSQTGALVHRRARLSTQVIAAASLAVLLLLDVVAVAHQDRSLAYGGVLESPVVAMQPSRQSQKELAWIREVVEVRGPLTTAALVPARDGHTDTYHAVLEDLMQNGIGG